MSGLSGPWRPWWEDLGSSWRRRPCCEPVFMATATAHHELCALPPDPLYCPRTGVGVPGVVATARRSKPLGRDSRPALRSLGRPLGDRSVGARWPRTAARAILGLVRPMATRGGNHERVCPQPYPMGGGAGRAIRAKRGNQRHDAERHAGDNCVQPRVEDRRDSQDSADESCGRSQLRPRRVQGRSADTSSLVPQSEGGPKHRTSRRDRSACDAGPRGGGFSRKAAALGHRGGAQSPSSSRSQPRPDRRTRSVSGPDAAFRAQE